MKKRAEAGYNERLFSSGFRKRLHLARFAWLAASVKRLNCPPERVLELGCFDGKALEYLPRRPTRYLGLDADWEGGLELAQAKWSGDPHLAFRKCHAPEEMRLNSERFDIAICMDTLEHVPPEMLSAYLAGLAGAASHIFVTVPNEKGIVFCGKYLAKKLLGGDAQPYSLREFLAAACGRIDRVARNEHKGFDYARFLQAFSQYADIVSVTGYPFARLPLFLNFGIGVVGKTRNRPVIETPL